MSQLPGHMAILNNGSIKSIVIAQQSLQNIYRMNKTIISYTFDSRASVLFLKLIVGRDALYDHSRNAWRYIIQLQNYLKIAFTWYSNPHFHTWIIIIIIIYKRNRNCSVQVLIINLLDAVAVLSELVSEKTIDNRNYSITIISCICSRLTAPFPHLHVFLL